MAVDGAGRVHFFGQIRYPKGIYHAYWDQGRWTPASLIYLIAQEGEEKEVEELGDKIAAHDTHPVVRAGNQLVLTFADSPADPNRRLFAMHRMLADIAPVEMMPTPTPMATPTPVSSPTPWQPAPVPTQTATAPFVDTAAAEPLERVPGWGSAIQVAVLPTLLLLVGFVVIRGLGKFRS
jgi:hypothetical protein